MTEDLRCIFINSNPIFIKKAGEFGSILTIQLKSFIWPDNTKDARTIQASLKDKIKIIPLKKEPKFIAGVDAAFSDDKIVAVACLYRYPALTPIEDAFAVAAVTFPYIPGFLSFREGPAIIEALKRLKNKPDVLLFDGQGIAHPKGLGIASHIGVLLALPTIGCAKSRLVGEYKEPETKKGAWSPLWFHDDVVGAVLRTKDNVRPLFISPGHKIDLQASIDIVLNCSTEYRLPEPLRRADYLSKKIKRDQKDSGDLN
jgi:deoxyribonuclease V